ncbi:hypothetical protein DL769_009462 [Monosporascus sp. CRB-8-3]|nr:hypothetical protein DL769_009462 [Monosporascus sp. CRB-8-3]
MFASARLRIFAFIFAGLSLIEAQQATFSNSELLDDFPVRDIAGVTVIDTPLVRAAELYARQHSTGWAYKHVMRSWLFGTLIVQHNDTLACAVDPEVHAVATLLHDLGWDPHSNSSIVSGDRRFEVDGAIAAREFLQGHDDGRQWDDRRTQLVWDSIALHAERSISYYKEPTVQVVSKGIFLDFSGPAFGVTDAEYAAIAAQFPREDLRDGVNSTIVWLCETKPDTTYGE